MGAPRGDETRVDCGKAREVYARFDQQCRQDNKLAKKELNVAGLANARVDQILGKTKDGRVDESNVKTDNLKIFAHVCRVNTLELYATGPAKGQTSAFTPKTGIAQPESRPVFPGIQMADEAYQKQYDAYLHDINNSIVTILSHSEKVTQILFSEYSKDKKFNDIEKRGFVASRLVDKPQLSAFALSRNYHLQKRFDPAAGKIIAEIAKVIAPMLVPDSVLDAIETQIRSGAGYFIAIDVETAAGAEAALARRDGREAGLRDSKRPADLRQMSGQHQIRQVGEGGALGHQKFIDDFEKGLFLLLLSPTEISFAHEKRKKIAKDKLKMREQYPKFGRVYYIVDESITSIGVLEYIRNNWQEILPIRIRRADDESGDSYWENAPLAQIIELLIVADAASP